MSLTQVIYASAAREKMTSEALQELLAQARAHNQANGITGMLVYRKGSFIQILEGAEADIDAVLARIRRDARHDKYKLLLRDTVPERDFDGWSMGFVDITGEARDLDGWLDYHQAFDTSLNDGGMAMKLLQRFRDGQWRQYA